MKENKRGLSRQKTVSLIVSLGIILTLGYGVYSVVTGVENSKQNNIMNLNDSENDNVALKTEDVTDAENEQNTDSLMEEANAGASSDRGAIRNGTDEQYDKDMDADKQNTENVQAKEQNSQNAEQSGQIEGVAGKDADGQAADVAANGTATSVLSESDAKIANAVAGYTFDESSTLSWPVAGDEVLKYSMDTTIYFPTLGVYKCNPAILIGAQAGSNIGVAADGIVQSVEVSEETGNTIAVAVGGGYVTTYGCVNDAVVKKGDTVVKGQLLGKVAEPTAYYSREGAGVYFKVTKDGEPVDPNMFLED